MEERALLQDIVAVQVGSIPDIIFCCCCCCLLLLWMSLLSPFVSSVSFSLYFLPHALSLLVSPPSVAIELPVRLCLCLSMGVPSLSPCVSVWCLLLLLSGQTVDMFRCLPISLALRLCVWLSLYLCLLLSPVSLHLIPVSLFVAVSCLSSSYPCVSICCCLLSLFILSLYPYLLLSPVSLHMIPVSLFVAVSCLSSYQSCRGHFRSYMLRGPADVGETPAFHRQINSRIKYDCSHRKR